MKPSITIFFIIGSLIGCAIYFLYISEQTLQHLTPRYWKTVTPEQLKVKLKNIKNVNKTRSDNKQNMLHLLAIYGQYPEMVSLLINADVDYLIKDNDNDGDKVTALHYATIRKKKAFEFAREILKYGMNVDSAGLVDDIEVTPLAYAIHFRSSVKLIQLLLDKGANPHFQLEDKWGHNAFMLAVVPNSKGVSFIDPDVIQLLLSYGVEIMLKNKKGDFLSYKGQTVYDYMKENDEFIKTKVFKKISIQFNK